MKLRSWNNITSLCVGLAACAAAIASSGGALFANLLAMQIVIQDRLHRLLLVVAVVR